MELNNSSMKIKTDILNSYMRHKTFVPKKLEQKDTKYALFDKNGKVLFSYLDGKDFKFKENFYEKGDYHYFISSLDEVGIPIKYIVLETCRGVQSRDKLKIYTVIAFILSSIFVGFIAYLLARILLKPVREKVIHLDNFIKDSAHELNTPVSVLMTSVSMLKKGKNPEKMMKYILSSSKQISQIYNDIQFSTFKNLYESVDENIRLDLLIHESVEFFSDISVTKNIVIETFLEECEILMDKTKAQKVVNNLISNAVKYSKKDSKIVVSLKKEGLFSVEDFGIGISKGEQEEIFKRYKRGLNNEGGFGLGLDIVKRVCNDYSLDLFFKSKTDKGSTFFVDFSKIIISR
ncbi:sensor histidine kinase [Halarcobacter anaerophilus]|nr:HAMP domain-containing sensor histidine kinase [Halarcobacter anaerophilus]